MFESYLEVILFFEVFIKSSNSFHSDFSLFENTVFIFLSNREKFETMPTDSNLFIRYLILLLIIIQNITDFSSILIY